MSWSQRSLVVSIGSLCWSATPHLAQASGDLGLTILHTNDVHSIYEFIDLDAEPCVPADQADISCFIPAARLSTAIREAKERNSNVILLDAGDQFPSPRYEVPAEIGRPLAAELMNRMGYDAMTLGNHEFDDGVEILARFVDDLAFPVLTANEVILSDPIIGEKLTPTAILEISAARIGLIGLGDNSDPSAPSPDVLAQKYTDQLLAQNINKIIAISHFGYATDKQIAERTTGIDVIVGGHSHTRLSNSPLGVKLGMTYPTIVDDVAIVQAYGFGVFLGELHLIFDDLGNLVSAEGDLIPMDTVADDIEIRALIEGGAKKIP